MVCAIRCWQPMASMVTRLPASASVSSSAEIAVISLARLSTRRWPSTSRASSSQALTSAGGGTPLAWSCEPRATLPSTATIPSCSIAASHCTHAAKQASNGSGSSRPMTRPKVSGEGMPCGSSRKVSSQACFWWPKNSTSVPLSAPQMTASVAIRRMTSRKWLRPGSAHRLRPHMDV